MKLAVLGGSFNPVHIGHLFLAEEVRLAFGYDKILFVPANISPFKAAASGASADDRKAMTEAAIAGNPFFQIDCCELYRGGVSYTFDTISFLEESLKDTLEEPAGLIIGDDLALDFGKWRRCDELAQKTRIILARRCLDSGARHTVFPWPHTALENSLLPVSSTDIRRRIAAGKSWRYLVPEKVYGYIRERKLYEYGRTDC